jgi:hypothetical protein
VTARKHTEPTPEPTEPVETFSLPAEEFPRTVRTTFEPGRDIEVTATEYAELKAQGVLAENKES